MVVVVVVVVVMVVVVVAVIVIVIVDWIGLDLLPPNSCSRACVKSQVPKHKTLSNQIATTTATTTSRHRANIYIYIYLSVLWN